MKINKTKLVLSSPTVCKTKVGLHRRDVGGPRTPVRERSVARLGRQADRSSSSPQLFLNRRASAVPRKPADLCLFLRIKK